MLQSSVTWNLTGASNQGAEYNFPNDPDKTVHIFGTFGGGTVTIQGSNEDDPLYWAPLFTGVTSTNVEVIAKCPKWIRPVVSGGNALTDVTIILVTHRATY